VGASSLVQLPALDGQARQFVTSWTGFGGERYAVNLGTGVSDSTSDHMVYSTSIYFTDLTHVDNIEMDINQDIPGGDTIIYGVQCAFAVGFWQYTTATNPTTSQWNSTTTPCTKTTWTANTWHTVSLASHRVGGVVTYDSVTFDGVTSNFAGASGNSEFTIGFSPVGLLLLNFQIDGDNTSNGTTTYLDNFSLTHYQ
jgi:hypothetical protein